MRRNSVSAQRAARDSAALARRIRWPASTATWSLEMADKHEEISFADYKPSSADIQVEEAWNQAKAYYAKLSLGFTPQAPDFAKIRKAMEKDKKQMCFRATFDGKWLSSQALVGSKVVDEGFSADISEGGDQKKWRTRLEAMKKNTKLVTDADLKDFDKKHSDPDKAEQLKSAIDSVKKAMTIKGIELKRKSDEVKKIQDELKTKNEELGRLQKALSALGG
jgi:hypothetical protein